MSECAASQHGTRTAYMNDQCRCPEARAAETAYKREYRRRRALQGPLTVDSTGTRRRIRALMAIGWPIAELDRRLGSPGNTNRVWQLLGSDETLTRTRDLIAALYDDLSMIPGPSRRAAERAKAKGYAPPLAWDNIDDLTERPKLPGRGEAAAAREARVVDEVAIERAAAGDAVRLTIRERALAVALLAGRGYTDGQIAARLRITDRSVHRIRGRAGIPSAVDAGRAPRVSADSRNPRRLGRRAGASVQGFTKSAREPGV